MIENTPHVPITIGIAGGTGSGKTTFSQELVARLKTDRIVYLSHDSYYKDLSHLPLEERIKQNFDHPDSLETDLLVKHILDLKAGKSVDIPVYSFVTHTRTAEVIHIMPQPVILVEGILIFAIKELREIMDVKIFVDTDADIRFMRRLKRDIENRGRTIESVYNQYLQEVRPMHDAFVEPSKRYADVIVPRGGKNTIALDMVAARIRSYLI
ncbi:uridine kinase [Flexilinea flocculi]|jgi:uridine kinase|uniref:Uridine kinase n=1 Tax=Flexilinea flocculi TaxID=1678840 RepID=A0A0K8PAK2_9CHLR|nr:uridine kinase [Flexilinea flocculi]NMB93583.1 uridine kinase [Flexilinea flocculi]GAP39666.1 uridine kinase [Flexilinea flocculi]